MIYVACRVIGSARAKRGLNGRIVRTPTASAA
jgi:zinc/manganese transport system permease protein